MNDLVIPAAKRIPQIGSNQSKLISPSKNAAPNLSLKVAKIASLSSGTGIKGSEIGEAYGLFDSVVM